MIGQIFDMILYPIQECLKMLTDSRITSYLGVSLMGCIVTCMLALVVVKALINPSAIGDMRRQQVEFHREQRKNDYKNINPNSPNALGDGKNIK